MTPSLLMIKPEPTEVDKRSLILKGSKEMAEMNTTAGETFLKTSTAVSVQADFADGSGLARPSKHREKKIEIRYFFM